MCLGIPGQLVEILDAAGHQGTVEVSGVRRPVSLQLLPDEGLGVGDWVLVHVGFALARIDEEQARQTLEQLAELGRLAADDADPHPGSLGGSPGRGSGSSSGGNSGPNGASTADGRTEPA